MGAAIFSAQATGGLWSQCTACGTVIDCGTGEWLQCDDDGGEFGAWRRERGRSGSCGGDAGSASESSGKARGGRRRHPADSRRGGGRSAEAAAQRLEDLTKELFTIHDLNRNGLLEEEELVTLNERIAVLHHGKGFDTSEVRATYRTLFREKLDPEGRPVEYNIFRAYALEVLHGLDEDPEAQEMILEQFVAEAQSGAALLDTPSMLGEEESVVGSVDFDGDIGGTPTAGGPSSPIDATPIKQSPRDRPAALTREVTEEANEVAPLAPLARVSPAAVAGEQEEPSPKVARCASDSSLEAGSSSAQGCTTPSTRGDGNPKTPAAKLVIDDAQQRSVRRSLPGALLAPTREALAACRASAGQRVNSDGSKEPTTSLVC